MRFRKLRIAWSVVWGLLAVLLIVLWVRSYLSYDALSIQLPLGYAYAGDSMSGRMSSHFYRFQVQTVPWRFEFSSISFEGERVELGGPIFHASSATGPDGTVWNVHFPHCFPIAVAAVLSAIPWWYRLGWRFSLRTLLIATTLLAVVLGLVVWGQGDCGRGRLTPTCRNSTR